MTRAGGGSPLVILGPADAAACEGDACVVPGTATAPVDEAALDPQPRPSDTAAASVHAVTNALDEGTSL
jgi:hypothetical protein